MPVKILKELRLKVRGPIADLEGRLIDLNPSDDGNYKTQDEWISYFNDRNEMMVSMPDIYMAGKSGNQALLDSLRKDIKESWIVPSTRIICNNNQDARIIHNYGSNLVQPVELRVVIPEYLCHPLEYILNTQDGLRYLQALFGTNDNAQQIKDTLHKLSDYAAGNTYVWSATLSVGPTERAAGLSCNYRRAHLGDGFHAYGNLSLANKGLSHVVRYASDSER